MKITEFARALRRMQPRRIVHIDGMYLILKEYQTEDSLRKQIETAQNQPHIADKRVYERYYANRFFIIRDVLYDMEKEDPEWLADDLLTFARMYAALLRDKLRQDFPDKTFVVEIRGEKNLTGPGKEPLELCVSFYLKGS